ncbi:MAG: FG-GAP repeat protein [Methanosaeta sp. PtaU1.Bin112]|nr:MAG: FG-GAP repeat protein [Methanosaeta sp. PtaU1.Bin112]
MRMTAFYLIACYLMLSQGVAVISESGSIDGLLALNSSNKTEFNQTACNYTTLNCTSANSPVFNSSKMVSSFFDSLDLNSSDSGRYISDSSNLESSEYEFSDLDYYDGYYDDYYDESHFSLPQSEPQVISLAFPADDLDGDNATDLLIMNISSDASNGAFDSEISALSGRNGSVFWQREYPGSLVSAQPAGDLNGDGRTDIMVNEILDAGSIIPYSSISAVCGINGTVIWSRSQILALTLAYPVQDTGRSNSTLFLVHIIGMDSINNRIFTSIARVNGSNGANIDERMFSDALAIEYPAGNLTDDIVPDSITAIYQLNGSLTGVESNGAGGNTPLNLTATMLEAKDGLMRRTLWNYSFACPALAMPIVDLTGDGRDELLVYLIRYSEYGPISSDIALLSGSEGEFLWQHSFSGLAFAAVGPDLTGEGLRDLIVYNWGESENAEVIAIKGDDGRSLWSKEGMIFIPS